MQANLKNLKSSTKLTLLAAVTAVGVAPANAEQLPSRLELACVGGGAANKPDVATLNAWGNNGGYASAQAYGTRSVGFEDQVSLWIDGEEGRIRMLRWCRFSGQGVKLLPT